MELAEETDGSTVGETTAGEELRALSSLGVEVAPDPRLALAQELVDQTLGPGPSATRRRRDRHDEPALGIDRDPQPARPGRSAEDVGDRHVLVTLARKRRGAEPLATRLQRRAASRLHALPLGDLTMGDGSARRAAGKVQEERVEPD